MSDSHLEEVVVQCSPKVIAALREQGYHIVKRNSDVYDTWIFRVTDYNQFYDKFINLQNKDSIWKA